jgi:putative FmdB family regulatory protein
MPIYEYRCAKCGERLEVYQQGFEPLALCGEHCRRADRAGDGRLERLQSVPAPLVPGARARGRDFDPERAGARGFTTYKRRKRGHYERVAGSSGPREIKA